MNGVPYEISHRWLWLLGNIPSPRDMDSLVFQGIWRSDVTGSAVFFSSSYLLPSAFCLRFQFYGFRLLLQLTNATFIQLLGCFVPGWFLSVAYDISLFYDLSIHNSIAGY